MRWLRILANIITGYEACPTCARMRRGDSHRIANFCHGCGWRYASPPEIEKDIAENRKVARMQGVTSTQVSLTWKPE